MTEYGTLGPFSGEAEEWAACVERLDLYFIANNITTTAKKRVILLSFCGIPTYKLIRSLVSQWKPSEVMYDNMIQKVTTYEGP